MRRIVWCVLCWIIVVHYLQLASPVFMDGSGPMPSFYWGHMPMPEFGEYMRHQRYYDFVYSIPYFLVGFLVTLAGCEGTPLIVRRLRIARRLFLSAAGITFALLLILALVSDAGALVRVWSGPLFVLHHPHDWLTIRALCYVFLPASVLSGVAVALRQTRGSRFRDSYRRAVQFILQPLPKPKSKELSH